jgi:hypothetical protein
MKLFIFLVFAVVLNCYSQESNLLWETNELNQVVITEVINDCEMLVIPKEIDGMPVVSINRDALIKRKIVKISSSNLVIDGAP